MNSIHFVGLERVLVVCGSILVAYLGFRLYALGLVSGRTALSSESKLWSFTVSGTGPGLMFMACGVIVMVAALFTGKGEVSEQVPRFRPLDRNGREEFTEVVIRRQIIQNSRERVRETVDQLVRELEGNGWTLIPPTDRSIRGDIDDR